MKHRMMNHRRRRSRCGLCRQRSTSRQHTLRHGSCSVNKTIDCRDGSVQFSETTVSALHSHRSNPIQSTPTFMLQILCQNSPADAQTLCGRLIMITSSLCSAYHHPTTQQAENSRHVRQRNLFPRPGLCHALARPQLSLVPPHGVKGSSGHG